MPQKKKQNDKNSNKKNSKKNSKRPSKHELAFIKKSLNKVTTDWYVLFILSCFQHVVFFKYFMNIFLSQYKRTLSICNGVFNIMKISQNKIKCYQKYAEVFLLCMKPSVSSVDAKIKKMSMIELYTFTKSGKICQGAQNLRLLLEEKL